MPVAPLVPKPTADLANDNEHIPELTDHQSIDLMLEPVAYR
jgi:hypothetical protein